MNQLDPRTMASLMQGMGPAAQQVLQQGQQPQPQQPVDPMTLSPIQRGYMTDQEQQQMDPNVWRQRGNSVAYQTPPQAQAQPQGPQGATPAQMAPMGPTKAEQLLALQPLYGP